MPNKIKKLISWDCPSILYILRNTLLIGQLWHKMAFYNYSYYTPWNLHQAVNLTDSTVFSAF